MRCGFPKLFLKQFFEIGNSAGSIIAEVIGLFRTFQRISSPKSFTTKFSKECINMFKWASEIFELIAENFQAEPLTTYEVFCIYALILPITIVVFISSVILGYKFSFNLIVYGLFLALGTGFGFIKINNSIAIGLCVAAGVLIVSGFIFADILTTCTGFSLFKLNPFECGEREIGQNTSLPSFFATIAACFFFFLTFIQIMWNRTNVGIIAVIGTILLCFIMFIHDICYSCHCCCKKNKPDIDEAAQKKCGFFINLLSLLIIPSTEAAIELIQNNYKNKWCIIATYVVVSLLLPMSMVIIMIISDHPDISEKYRESNFFSFNIYNYVELVDIIKQVIYAILASYDILWGCIGIEIGWFILIIVLRPYQAISEYSLASGNSLLIFISNGIIIHANKHQSDVFSYKAALIWASAACIPAFVSIYLFFIFDFGDEDSAEDDNIEEINYGMGYIATILAPIVWFFYGTNLPLISNYIKATQM